MKILAFADLHSSITSLKKIEKKIKSNKPDVIFCLGDFTIFEQNIEAVMQRIDDFGIPTYVLHGNHEDEVIVNKLCKRFKNLIFTHKKIIQLDKYLLVGHGGGGFYGQGKLDEDKDFMAFMKKHQKKFKGDIIFLTHAPPAHTKLDYMDKHYGHVGCPTYTKFIDKYKPLLAFSGHIHETFNKTEKRGKTKLANVGPEGMVFKL